MRNQSLVALLAEGRSTDLQRALFELNRNLAFVRGLSTREQATFADIGQRAIVHSLGPTMVVAEAENLTRRAA